MKTAFLFLLLLTPVARAQTPPAAAGTASVAGQVKVGEKGVANAIVSLAGAQAAGAQAQSPQRGPQPPASMAATDAEGRFEIRDLAAGSYRVTITAPGYVLTGTPPTVQIGDGQAVKDLAFTLAQGGVITGKATSGSRPVIDEPVIVSTTDAAGQATQTRLPNGNEFRTDDRGVYRLFGLPAGSYLVSVGRGGAGSGSPWQRTYYPDAAATSDATPVRVEAGQEVADIDIHVAARQTYAIVGHVVDADSSAPIPGILIAHDKLAPPRGNRGNQQQQQGVVIESATDAATNAAGEFRIDGQTSGSYRVYVARDGASEFYSDPVSVELKSGDATGVEIKLQRGASVAGLVVFDGGTDPAAQANLPNLVVRATVRSTGQGGGQGGGRSGSFSTDATAQPEATGLFRVAGLAPGLVSLTLVDRGGNGPPGLTLLRVERNGADQQAGLRVESGEQVTGVRLVAAYGNSSLRGLVRVEGGGALPPQLRLSVSARRTDASASVRDRAGRNVQVDASGRFEINQLVAGTYELTLQGGGLGRDTVAPITVTLGSGAVQNVTIPFNPAAATQPPQPGNNRRGGGTRP